MDEVDQVDGWHPMTIYEPIPARCVPEELPALRAILPKIDILSPNAVEALTILSMPVENVTRIVIEDACSQFLAMGVGKEGKGAVIIRSGELGAYVKQIGREGLWVDAYWGGDRPEKVVDVTGKGEYRIIRLLKHFQGAGNAFLGGLAGGLALGKNLYQGKYNLPRYTTIYPKSLHSRSVRHSFSQFHNRTIWLAANRPGGSVEWRQPRATR